MKKEKRTFRIRCAYLNPETGYIEEDIRVAHGYIIVCHSTLFGMYHPDKKDGTGHEKMWYLTELFTGLALAKMKTLKEVESYITVDRYLWLRDIVKLYSSGKYGTKYTHSVNPEFINASTYDDVCVNDCGFGIEEV